MMPSIQLSQATFERLQMLAEPLVDTPESIIKRLLDSHGSAFHPAKAAQPLTVAKPREFDPLKAPKLTHTKVFSASFAGRELAAPGWNRLLDEALSYAMKQLVNFEEIKRIAVINIVEGKKEDEGYHHLTDVGISVQGQDANSAWRGTIYIARRLNVPVEVEFAWRDKEGAERPGEAGKMTFSGKSSS
jgi:hypothetical protein